MSSSSITKIPQCIYCGQVFETWTGNKCECEGATESRAARQADLDAKAAIQAEANQRLIPIAPVVVDDGWARLRREAAKDQAAARQDADIADRERAVKERELSRRERRQDDAITTGVVEPDWEGFSIMLQPVESTRRGTTWPSILSRTDGKTLMYAQKVNILAARPNGGKSFISMKAANEAIEKGGRCIILDFDNRRPDTLADRAKDMGVLHVFQDKE